MKKILGLALILALPVFAMEIKVDKMSPVKGFDRSYYLHTKSIEKQVILDCQSFVQGLTIGKGNAATFFLLEPQDCESLFLRTRESLKKLQKHCLDVENGVRADYTCS
jgi:hypothetical protein